MLQEICLNTVEQRIAKFVAKTRHDTNRSKGVVDKKVGGQGAEQTDLDGIGAELAYCKITNSYPDFDDSPGTWDALSKKGARIDVKTTRYRGGHLVSRMGSNSDAEIYVLLVGEFPSYRVAGWTTADHLMGTEINLGRGPTHGVPQPELINTGFTSGG